MVIGKGMVSLFSKMASFLSVLASLKDGPSSLKNDSLIQKFLGIFSKIDYHSSPSLSRNF